MNACSCASRRNGDPAFCACTSWQDTPLGPRAVEGAKADADPIEAAQVRADAARAALREGPAPGAMLCRPSMPHWGSDGRLVGDGE